MSGLRYAVGLLTRIPVAGTLDEAARSRSLPWYPVVGAGVGLVTGIAAYGTAYVLPDLTAGFVAVAVAAVTTGALHLDGLGDLFDGFVGGRDREDRLRIMRDPRLGTFGAAAVFVALAVQASLLAAIASQPLVVAAAATAGAVSRAVTAVVMGTTPSAAAGLGASHAGAATRLGIVVAGGAGVGAAVGLGGGGVAGLAVGAVAAAVVVRWARRMIGGITGDVLGAVQVVSELGFLAGVVGMSRW